MARLLATFCFLIVLGSIAIGVAPSYGAGQVPVVAPSTVVFWESNFPAADTAAPSPAQIETLIPGAKFSGDDELQKSLALDSTRLLVLPYGSAFPEDAASAIHSFLERRRKFARARRTTVHSRRL